MSDKPRKTAGDLKLIIEEKLRAGHPEFERAEVVIIPPVADQPWAASLFGTGLTIDQECRKRIDSIVALRELRVGLSVGSSGLCC